MLNVKNERIKLGHSNVSNVDFKQEFAYLGSIIKFSIDFSGTHLCNPYLHSIQKT